MRVYDLLARVVARPDSDWPSKKGPHCLTEGQRPNFVLAERFYVSQITKCETLCAGSRGEIALRVIDDAPYGRTPTIGDVFELKAGGKYTLAEGTIVSAKLIDPNQIARTGE